MSCGEYFGFIVIQHISSNLTFLYSSHLSAAEQATEESKQGKEEEEEDQGCHQINVNDAVKAHTYIAVSIVRMSNGMLELASYDLK